MEQLLRQDVVAVAEQLLGWSLRSEIGGAVTAVTITETEAYAGEVDPASHAFRGLTRRNKSMFGRAGLLYVYRSYGIHWCMNVVVGEVDQPHAVLLRGGIATSGIDIMKERRGRADHLSDGPGKLCQALGVTGEHDGHDLRRSPLRLEKGPGIGGMTVQRTPRIGISRATDRLWRFVAVG
ncbi:MAG: DNA-3-methyladenine glycosylase [Acidimicrobiia bacterium]|nr:DNA-3-methyladenine glycosylase [Acidimicrobiia bacterium]